MASGQMAPRFKRLSRLYQVVTGFQSTRQNLFAKEISLQEQERFLNERKALQEKHMAEKKEFQDKFMEQQEKHMAEKKEFQDKFMEREIAMHAREEVLKEKEKGMDEKQRLWKAYEQEKERAWKAYEQEKQKGMDEKQRLWDEKERVWKAYEQEMKMNLEIERKLNAISRIDLLREKGLNNTRGLFEYLQAKLAQNANVLHLRGVPLWEALVQSNTNLAACITRCTGVSATQVYKQAVQVYNVYNILSQHIHEGKSLAELQAGSGPIFFDKGPLTTEQMRILECLGDAAKVQIQRKPIN